ncbi:ATP-binding protein [Thermodesulfobacteriota bacterium]
MLNKTGKFKKTIAFRLLITVIIVSACCTLLLSGIEIYTSHQKALQNLEKNFQNIQDTSLPSISANLWLVDTEQLQLLLQGLLNFNHITKVTLETKDTTLLTVGSLITQNHLQREYPLFHTYNDTKLELGKLTVYADLTSLRKDTFRNSFSLILYEAVHVFLISFFVLLTVKFLITRHLVSLSELVSDIDPRICDLPLTLPTRKTKTADMDELDQVLAAINSLSANIKSIILELENELQRRIKTEKSLLTEKQFTERLIDALTDTFFVFEPETGKALRWNKNFESISEYSPEEISRLKAPETYYSEKDLQKSAQAMDVVMEQGQAPVELDLITKSGKKIPFEYSGSLVVSPEDNRPCIISIGRNISQRLQAEQEKEKLEAQLRQAQKMEAIGTLAGGIAHDFNNILASVLGFADLARYNIPAEHPAARHIEEVIKASYRARDLVSHILAFSRKSDHERKPLQIHLILKEALKLLQPSIPSTIEIRQNIDPGCGNILADPTQIHQIIINLCTNAYQAMEEKGGVLTITLSSQTISQDEAADDSEFEPGEYVLLTVSDTGPGIAPKILNRIFEPYFTTKEIGKGSGLGLSVIHGIVSTHRGIIRVKSTPGKGTAIHVYFPRIEIEPATEIESLVMDQPSGGTEHILVVDDDENIVHTTQIQLEQLGYTVTATSDSLQALELFRARPEIFDLVLTDQTMPNMTGIKMAGRMMETRSDIRVILCTGYSSQVNEETARVAGIKAFVMKPLDNRELAKAVRIVLDNGELFHLQ